MNSNRPEFNSPRNSNGKSRKRLAGMVGGAALAAAVAFGGGTALNGVQTSFAQTAAATPSAAATTPAATTPSTTTPAANGAKSPLNQRGGDKGGERGGFGGNLSGTISSISGNSLTLMRGNVIVIQATLNSSTVYSKAGQTISQADLKTGQQVAVRTTTAADGTVTVSAVEVVLSHSSGTVSAIDAGSLTLTRSDNSTVKAALSASTTYQDLGKTISQADIKSGMRLEVAGTANADGSLNAEVVTVQHDRLGGTVTAVSGSTITVQSNGRGGRGGPGNDDDSATTAPANGSAAPAPATGNAAPAPVTRTITVSGSTVYLAGGQSSALSDIAVGSSIQAEGTLSSDGNSLTALQVQLELPHYQGQVTSVSGNTIVIQDRAGTSRTIEVGSATKFLNGTAAAALSDVKAGANVSVEGKVDASGKMTAAQVQLGQGGKGGQGQGGHGHGGR